MMMDELRKAHRALQTARVDLDTGDGAASVNRSYYAMYYAARAMLMSAGADIPKTHSALIGAFSRRFTEIDRSEHYYWLQRVGGIRYYFAARLYCNPAQSAYASLNRASGEGPVETHNLDLVARLVPHLRQADLIKLLLTSTILHSAR
jgi:HEPN domain-containing protein